MLRRHIPCSTGDGGNSVDGPVADGLNDLREGRLSEVNRKSLGSVAIDGSWPKAGVLLNAASCNQSLAI